MFRLPNENLSPLSKVILTTGQVAKVCRVAPRTVAKWVDAGMIPGSYRIPGSTDRRIPAVGVRDFMQRNGMTAQIPPTWGCEVLFVDLPQAVQMGVAACVRHCLPEDSQHVRYRTASGAVAVAYAALYQPLVIFTSLLPPADVLAALRTAVRLPANGGDTFLIAMVGEDDGVAWTAVPGRYGVDYGLPASRYSDEEPTAAAVDQMRVALVAARDRWQQA